MKTKALKESIPSDVQKKTSQVARARANAEKGQAGGLILELGVGAALIGAVVGLVDPVAKVLSKFVEYFGNISVEESKERS